MVHGHCTANAVPIDGFIFSPNAPLRCRFPSDSVQFLSLGQFGRANSPNFGQELISSDAVHGFFVLHILDYSYDLCTSPNSSAISS